MPAATDATLTDRLFAAVQTLLPTRFLSLCMYRLTRIESPRFKNAFIRLFMRLFKISLEEAELSQGELYPTFNAFFTRALKEGARPLDPDWRCVVSPVDGTVSQLGDIRGDRVFQAKGHDYSVIELLGGDPQTAAPFSDGHFCTIYLAPYNYHRIHMPLRGSLREWIYVPGRLFSVNQATARAIPGLFALNERVVCIFDSEIGPFAMVLVGALFVGSMETVWAGRVTPPHSRKAEVAGYQPMQQVALERGAEMGRFNMGSTVILLAGRDALRWNEQLRAGGVVRMGQRLADRAVA